MKPNPWIVFLRTPRPGPKKTRAQLSAMYATWKTNKLGAAAVQAGRAGVEARREKVCQNLRKIGDVQQAQQGWVFMTQGHDGKIFERNGVLKKVFFNLVQAKREEHYLDVMDTTNVTPRCLDREGKELIMTKVPGITLQAYLAKLKRNRTQASVAIQNSFFAVERALVNRNVYVQDSHLNNYMIDEAGQKVYRIDFGKAEDIDGDEDKRDSVLEALALRLVDQFPLLIQRWRPRLQQMNWNRHAKARLGLH